MLVLAAAVLMCVADIPRNVDGDWQFALQQRIRIGPLNETTLSSFVTIHPTRGEVFTYDGVHLSRANSVEKVAFRIWEPCFVRWSSDQTRFVVGDGHHAVVVGTQPLQVLGELDDVKSSWWKGSTLYRLSPFWNPDKRQTIKAGDRTIVTLPGRPLIAEVDGSGTWCLCADRLPSSPDYSATVYVGKLTARGASSLGRPLYVGECEGFGNGYLELSRDGSVALVDIGNRISLDFSRPYLRTAMSRRVTQLFPRTYREGVVVGPVTPIKDGFAAVVRHVQDLDYGPRYSLARIRASGIKKFALNEFVSFSSYCETHHKWAILTIRDDNVYLETYAGTKGRP